MYTLFNPTYSSYDTVIDQDLMVRIANQTKTLVVKELPSLALSRMQSIHDEFKPSRIVGNFVIVNAKSPKIIEADLSPAIEVHITYGEEDVARLQKAYEAYQLSQTDEPAPSAVVGYWDKTHWVKFTFETHALRWDPAEPSPNNNWTPATAIVQITYWPDPPLASGPP